MSRSHFFSLGPGKKDRGIACSRRDLSPSFILEGPHCPLPTLLHAEMTPCLVLSPAQGLAASVFVSEPPLYNKS